MGEGRSDATGFAPTMALRAADGKGAAPSQRRAWLDAHSWQPRLTGRAAPA